MNCDKFQSLWNAWQHNEVQSDTKWKMVVHLLDCEDCQHYDLERLTSPRYRGPMAMLNNKYTA